MKKPITILHVADTTSDAEVIQTTLTLAGLACEITRVQTREEFAQALRQRAYDLVLASNDRSERQLAETALPASQQALEEERYLLRTLVDHMPDAIYFKDAASRFVRLNQATARDLGVDDPARAVGKTDFDFFSPESAQQAYEDEQAIMRSGQAVVGKEEKILRPDGRVRWASTTKMPLYDQAGQIMGVFGLSRDIGERKQMEAALLESESRYREIFENTPDWVFFVEVLADEQQFRIMDVNPVFEKTTGRPRTDLIGKTIEEAVSPGIAQAVNARCRQCVATRQAVEQENEISLPTGRKRTYLSTAIPIQDAEGRVRRILGITRDVTERKQLEAALLESENRYREIFENTPDWVFFLEVLEDGQHFRNLDVNPVYEKTMGISRADFIGKTIEETASPEAAQIVNARYRRCVATRQIVEHEYELTLPSGRGIFHSTAIPIQDAAGRVRRVLGITRNVTQQRQAEEALQKEHAQVQALLDEQLAFARNISHELRTPLTTLRLRTEALRFETLDDATTKRYLEEVDDEIVRLGNVVQDVMVLARFDAGRGELGQEEIDIARLATILCAQLEPLAQKQQVVLTLTGCDQPLLVHAGLAHLTVVLRNLLDNALKYTPSGGQVSCTLATLEEGVEIRIQDTGQGIAPDDLLHIFERFYRADRMHSDDIPGTGLGLALVKSIVDAYGGRIDAHSEGSGRGSTFSVFLPKG